MRASVCLGLSIQYIIFGQESLSNPLINIRVVVVYGMFEYILILFVLRIKFWASLLPVVSVLGIINFRKRTNGSFGYGRKHERERIKQKKKNHIVLKPNTSPRFVRNLNNRRRYSFECKLL